VAAPGKLHGKFSDFYGWPYPTKELLEIATPGLVRFLFNLPLPSSPHPFFAPCPSIILFLGTYPLTPVSPGSVNSCVDELFCNYVTQQMWNIIKSSYTVGDKWRRANITETPPTSHVVGAKYKYGLIVKSVRPSCYISTDGQTHFFTTHIFSHSTNRNSNLSPL